MRRLFFIPVLLLALFCVSCADNYGACVKAGSIIASSINNADNAVNSIRIAGYITPTEELNVLDYLKFANDANGAFLSCASIGHAGGSRAGVYTTCAQTFVNSLSTPQELNLLIVANPSAQLSVDTISQTIKLYLNTLISGLGGA